MRCVITGVAGFVGSTLCDKLLSLGHQVVGIDCFTEYYARPIKERNLVHARAHPAFTFIEDSLLTCDLHSLLDGAEWVFHQAAQAGVRKSWGSYFETYTNCNVLATQRLLEQCRQNSSLKRFVYASSSSVYGDAESFPTPETVNPRPVSPYGVTKLAAEHLACLYATEFGLPTVSLRYFTVYGPRQRPDMAFNRFISDALAGRTLTVYGDGEQSRDFTFIEDIVAANILAAERGEHGGVYNLGGGTQATVNQVLDIMRSELGDFAVQYLERQAGDARHTSADTRLARTVLGFAPVVDLKEGIRREVQWLRECHAEGLNSKRS
ncbi:MAG: NAD-dependent epimerase/dehydratase family protein [Proteobacteria bacterium]|nr:NAD-dependent epimerase/dehydratase family protein [Pseudomonadota bacterium]